MTMRRVSSVSRPMYMKNGRFGIILCTSARPRRKQPRQIQLFVPVCAFVRYPCKLIGAAYLHDRHREQKSARRTTAVNLLSGKCILQEGKALAAWKVTWSDCTGMSNSSRSTSSRTSMASFCLLASTPCGARDVNTCSNISKGAMHSYLPWSRKVSASSCLRTWSPLLGPAKYSVRISVWQNSCSTTFM